MKTLLLLIFTLHLTSAVRHSLRYFYTGVTPGINFPEFTVVGLLDGDQFVYYDSNIKRMISKTEWIKKHKDEDYWTSETVISQKHEEIFNISVVTLMQRFNHIEGVHTVQLMYGCELDDDGTKRGHIQYGYDGEDYISLDMNTHTWTAPNDKAVITKHKWDSSNWTDQSIAYLENTCTEWLQTYVGYGRDALERRVHPEVFLFQKNSDTLVCHATGFFPGDVQFSWFKNGQDMNNFYYGFTETETLPNQDGTFQKKCILRILPEEWENEYTCVVQDSGVRKKLVIEAADGSILNRGVSGEGDLSGGLDLNPVVVFLIIGGAGVLVFLFIFAVGIFNLDACLCLQTLRGFCQASSSTMND
ncbi:H-2 class I histocompatibility antigen, Q10 alpha chain-like isoform X1 [Brachyhypopomus gauderio]|uniref:H-2 class I histocompatibility antigen, Q10 alpha chain-like isoform X1 n=1 Tax=Brachyhypopomus gauderio TaxID=698409 RepID=UPI0040433FDB